ncbi:MAG: SPOR domain-containing protein [Pseudomonadota bacterium]
MTQATETFEDEYEEYDEFDDEEDERGLSGFVVLIMGIVMLGAFAAVVWIAYQQGMKTGASNATTNTPYVAADPEPVKIETANAAPAGENREVYDAFDGDDIEPVTVLADGPEEPVSRDVSDPIGAIAAEVEDAAAAASEEVEDRLASLAAQDAAALNTNATVPSPGPAAAAAADAVENAASAAAETARQAAEDAASAARSAASNAAPASAVDALSGNYVVQVGAFGSNSEAVSNWSRMQIKLGSYLDGKASHVERADLGSRGVYHRLRIGPFTTAEAAKNFCTGLKVRGQDCLIKAN